VRAHFGVRLLAALQAFLLLSTLMLPALAFAEEPTDSPPPATEPADPTVPPTDPPAEPTEQPPAQDPDPTAEPAAPTPTQAPVAGPTITSDLDDYPPGGLVTLTGTNWAAGELVHIYVNDQLGSSWNRNVDVLADASGEIYDQFNLPNWFVAEYQVVASSPTSGVATHWFTDSQPQSLSPNAPLSATVTAGSTATTYGNVTANFNGNSNACTVSYSAFAAGGDTGLPAGTSPTFTVLSSSPASNTSGNNPMTWNGGVGSASLKFEIGTTSGTATGTYTFHLRVTRASGGGCQGTAGTSEASAAQLSLTVNAPANSAPVADDETVSATEDTVLDTPVGTLLAGDTDVDGDTLFVSAVSGATGGTAVLNDNGTPGLKTDDFVRFTPTANLCGVAVGGYDYTVSDGALTDTGHVTVNISCVNDAPVVTLSAANDLTIDEGDSSTYSFTVTDDDMGDTF
jgi:hypothetical protein